MRLLGLMLDDIYNKDEDVDAIYDFLKDNKRELKLVLFNKLVTDEEVAKFVKKHENKLINLGTKITRDMTEPCYFLISTEDIVHAYFMKFSGSLDTGIKTLQELFASADHRKKHNR